MSQGSIHSKKKRIDISHSGLSEPHTSEREEPHTSKLALYLCLSVLYVRHAELGTIFYICGLVINIFNQVCTCTEHA